MGWRSGPGKVQVSLGISSARSKRDFWASCTTTPSYDMIVGVRERVGKVHLQVVLLPPRPCVLVQVPLHIAFLVVQRARPDLKQPHAHPWPNLCQLDRLEARLHEDVVSHLDRVLDVLESTKEY